MIVYRTVESRQARRCHEATGLLLSLIRPRASCPGRGLGHIAFLITLWMVSLQGMCSGIPANSDPKPRETKILKFYCRLSQDRVETITQALGERGSTVRDLPYLSFHILMPSGCVPVSWEASPGLTSAEGSSPLNCIPAPLLRARRGGASRAPVEYLGVQRLGGCTLGIFRFFPYRDDGGTPILQAEWTLSVRTEIASLDEAHPPALSARGALARRLAEVVSNPDMILSVIAGLNFAPTSPNATPCDHLIITGRAFETAFAPLVARRIREGVQTETVSVEGIQATQTGIDLPEKIRNFIRAAYQERGVTSVLLGGDAQLIPTRMAFLPRGGSLANSLVPCDLYYGCLDGTWNRNSDERWGESTDGEDGGDVDLLSEVDIGRAPVRNAEDAKTFVEKTLAQSDGGIPAASAVLLKDSLPAPIDGPEGHPRWSVKDSLAGWNLIRLVDDTERKTAWTPDQALEALNRSPNVVAFYGHGDAEENRRLSPELVARMTNQSPFLFTSIGCELGRFDHDAISPPSLGEQLILRPKHGAFATVLNAREGWFDLRTQGRYSHEFQESLFHQLNAGTDRSLGRMLSASKEAFLGSIERNGYMPYRACFLQWTLLGDPQSRMRFRFRTPPPGPNRSRGGTNAP